MDHAKIISAYFSYMSQDNIQAIIDAEHEIAIANAHHGLNSQVKANVAYQDAVKSAIADIPEFYLNEIEGRVRHALSESDNGK